MEFPWPVAQFILQHHERLDGSGYPRGLARDAILQEAKVLAVADVIDAMMTRCPYREGLGLEAALREIETGKGKLYHGRGRRLRLAVQARCFQLR